MMAGKTVVIPPPGRARRSMCRRIGKAVFPKDYDPMSYATDWGEKRGMAATDALIERFLSAMEKGK